MRQTVLSGVVIVGICDALWGRRTATCCAVDSSTPQAAAIAYLHAAED